VGDLPGLYLARQGAPLGRKVGLTLERRGTQKKKERRDEKKKMQRLYERASKGSVDEDVLVHKPQNISYLNS